MAEPFHIAVVDDEIKTREMIGDYLALHGMRVTLCDGGRSLRKLIAGDTPDLVVLDLNMPEEDGLSIVRDLKTGGGVPVIMLTASASPIDRVVGLELGADDYIAKPCELRELLARVRTVLRRVPLASTTRTDRRLAAIASFDVVGFSRLVQEDEPGTRAAIDAVMAETIAPGLERFRGTLFKMLGDGGLVEFSSLVNAVDWALAFQTTVGPRAGALPPLRFRVGIAIGDIVVKNDDRFGEGIALAVRIQEKSWAGGVALSDYAFNLLRGKTSATFVDGGLQKLKHFVEETTIWHWSRDAG